MEGLKYQFVGACKLYKVMKQHKKMLEYKLISSKSVLLICIQYLLLSLSIASMC